MEGGVSELVGLLWRTTVFGKLTDHAGNVVASYSRIFIRGLKIAAMTFS